MARRSRMKLAVTFAAIPPDERPAGPFIGDNLPYGQKEHEMHGKAMAHGSDIWSSNVMDANNCKGYNAKWAKGVRTISSWDLSRGENPLLRNVDEET